jgi:hypothetical protein
VRSPRFHAEPHDGQLACLNRGVATLRRSHTGVGLAARHREGQALPAFLFIYEETIVYLCLARLTVLLGDTIPASGTRELSSGFRLSRLLLYGAPLCAVYVLAARRWAGDGQRGSESALLDQVELALSAPQAFAYGLK